MINTKFKELAHTYKLRSCTNCENVYCPTREREIKDNLTWSDKAKYACTSYVSSDKKLKNEPKLRRAGFKSKERRVKNEQ